MIINNRLNLCNSGAFDELVNILRGYGVLGYIPQESKRGAMLSHVLENCFTWKIARGRQICLRMVNMGIFVTRGTGNQ